MDQRILHIALGMVFSDLDRNSRAVRHDDHIAVEAEGDISLTVRVFWPDVFQRMRDKFHITLGEIRDELEHGPLVVSELAGECDSGCLFSARERIVVRGLSSDEYAMFRDTFEAFSSYTLEQDETLLPLHIAFFRIETSIKLKTKSQYFTVSRSLFPRQNHEHLFFLDLKGCSTRARTEEGGILKDGDVTWEHEMSFTQQEREDVLRVLKNDVHFLQNLNMTNYSLMVAITKRYVQTSLQLPGQPYGPDANENESDDHKKTLPIRHDLADGAKAIRADLVPKPRFCDEHPEWEYYFGLIDVQTPFKTKAKIARAFRIAMGASKEDISNMPPLEYGERFINFMESTIFPSYFEEG
mmetsp:Transcript_8660/g.12932  ORF Transcript_8660/g.12932 Transcript_8660/m.12932 type:complete len:354 (+) Transcript_8660:150-1211(+)|eukprot:CAMPEP_0185029394 /NCGR_PEP_ID=MMETSP1103-20130426/15680_1 /TAXON_ID=36769 /ORGANISM="Paraphysomonas bandaiensis, Strain Caron Lab Isolate" /LENGTH=353 /DNA_ID=CAMNT_0027564117 /DNA_START=62 /DNA_END=1123 /DNA_ORIENTATION=+